MQQFFEKPSPPGAAERRFYRLCPYCGAELFSQDDGLEVRMHCPSCGFTQFLNPFPGVAVLVIDGGKVLLGRRAASSFGAGTWGLPGGFIEFDENFLTAAHREVYEETGLQVEIEGIVNVVSNFLSPRLHTLVIVLTASVTGGQARPGDDLVELAWFDLDGPLPEMAFEADAFIVRHAAGRPARLPVDPRFRNWEPGS